MPMLIAWSFIKSGQSLEAVLYLKCGGGLVLSTVCSGHELKSADNSLHRAHNYPCNQNSHSYPPSSLHTKCRVDFRI